MKRAKGWAAWGIVLLTLGLLVFGAWGLLQTLSQPRTNVMLGQATYRVSLARTDAEQKQGLSGVDHLDEFEGKLFIFQSDGPQPMWMKDMDIPIDIVWLDKDKRVTQVESNVSPDTYPQTFSSEKPARYVLEIPAGSAKENAIKSGLKASFDLN